MVFVNESSLMATLHNRNCLEMIQFPDMKITTYAGLCGSPGSAYNTHRLVMRIAPPIGIAYNGRDMIYVSISDHKIIVAIDMTSGMGEIFSRPEDQPRYLSYDKWSGDIFVSMTGGFGVIRANQPENNIARLTGDGADIGFLNNTIINTGAGLARLDEGVWIMADSILHR